MSLREYLSRMYETDCIVIKEYKKIHMAHVSVLFALEFLTESILNRRVLFTSLDAGWFTIYIEGE